jgi:hypothetical protein
MFIWKCPFPDSRYQPFGIELRAEMRSTFSK